MLRSHRHFTYEYFGSFFHSRPQIIARSERLLLFCHQERRPSRRLRMMVRWQLCQTLFWLRPLFRITWYFWTSIKYSGAVSLMFSKDILRKLTQCVTNIFLSIDIIKYKHCDFTLCPSSPCIHILHRSVQYCLQRAKNCTNCST